MVKQTHFQFVFCFVRTVSPQPEFIVFHYTDIHILIATIYLQKWYSFEQKIVDPAEYYTVSQKIVDPAEYYTVSY